jgi:hypothetical protein
VLFEKRFWDGIADGKVTVTFRRWKRVQARAGRTQRTPGGIVLVTAVDVVSEPEISDDDARASGYEDAATLVADLRGEPGLPIYRVRFRLADGPDPRAELASTYVLTAVDVAAVSARLARLDRSSPHGPWTVAVLEAIAARPGVRAADLAESFGRDLASFKLDVRKLKNLGLTESLAVGYRLSPRGAAYLASGVSGRH